MSNGKYSSTDAERIFFIGVLHPSPIKTNNNFMIPLKNHYRTLLENLQRRTVTTLNSTPHTINRIPVPQNVLATGPLLKTPLSQAQQQYATAATTYTAVAARAYNAAAAAATQPALAGYATVAGVINGPDCEKSLIYAREFADPYLGHGIGPVPGYGATMYRGGFNRFAPY
uniref:Uncharacterized protein n=1 Tax=Glossina brevipalpis TaxID=37001 RepID=A0A1A9WT89_9MUSC